MAPRIGICDTCGTVDLLCLVACDNLYVCPICSSAVFNVPPDEVRAAFRLIPINPMTDEIVGFYAYNKAAIDLHIARWKGMSILFMFLDAEHRLFYVHMPCGYQKAFYDPREIPDRSVPCDCGWPNHWFLKYAEEPEEVDNEARHRP